MGLFKKKDTYQKAEVMQPEESELPQMPPVHQLPDIPQRKVQQRQMPVEQEELQISKQEGFDILEGTLVRALSIIRELRSVE